MSVLKGIALKVLATIIFVVMGSLIKAIDHVPIGEIVFARNAFALVPILLLMSFRGQLATAFKTKRPGGHILRATIGGSSMFFVFTALQLLTLPDATAIGFATPIFSVVFAALLLGEVIRIYRWSAVLIGFVGVMIMLSPYLSSGSLALFSGADGSAALKGAIFALLGAIGSALAMIQVRRLTMTEGTPAIVFYFSLVASVFGLATLPFGWVMPDLQTALMLTAIGLIGGIGQIALTESYRNAPASVIAPFDYLTMIWSIIIGYFFFSETATKEVLIGACLVIGAGIFVIFREARIGVDRTAQKKHRVPLG